MNTLPVTIPRQIGLYVRRSREAQNITREQLAKRSGISVRTLASLELGDATGIRLDKLLAVYQVLGLELLTKGECISREEAAQRKAERAVVSRQADVASIKDSANVTDFQQSHPSYDDALNGFILAHTNVVPEAPLSFTRSEQ